MCLRYAIEKKTENKQNRYIVVFHVDDLLLFVTIYNYFCSYNNFTFFLFQYLCDFHMINEFSQYVYDFVEFVTILRNDLQRCRVRIQRALLPTENKQNYDDI